MINLVDLAVERRRTGATILVDPNIARFVRGNKAFRRVMGRMNRLLNGNDAGPDGPVRTAMLIAAISGTAGHPLVVGLDDDVLRTQLMLLAKRLLDPV